MRFLFSFVGGQGHFDPLVPLARGVRSVAHDVTFACRPSMIPIVEGRGFAAVGVGPDVPDHTAITPLLAYDAAREERVLRDGFARHTALRRAEDLIELCSADRADVIVADEVDYGALIAAERIGYSTCHRDRAGGRGLCSARRARRTRQRGEGPSRTRPRPRAADARASPRGRAGPTELSRPRLPPRSAALCGSAPRRSKPSRRRERLRGRPTRAAGTACTSPSARSSTWNQAICSNGS